MQPQAAERGQNAKNPKTIVPKRLPRLSSVANAKKPFLVKDILLSVHSNHIPGCIASVNIYRIEGKKETFVNVLHKPIYFDIAVTNEP